MRPYFEGGENCSFGDFYIRSQAAGLSPSTLRVSVGIASIFADVDRFARFARTFLDASQEEVASAASPRNERLALADTA